ncbi:MAG: saccharopine dehydrogenase [Phycisphaerae bacterium]|nr:saccharopine dehydrogenase [Phycisphaerae bacterium]
MRMLLLGAGRQGKAVLHDLIHSPDVQSVTCAEVDLPALKTYLAAIKAEKVEPVALDASDPKALRALMARGFDVAIDMLPRQFIRNIGQAAVDCRLHLVNTYYDHDLRDLADAAEEASVSLLPEMGMDPGIDLVLCGEAVRRLDQVTRLVSYGGGFPEPPAIDNPLKYKITWTWEGVLNSYVRDAVIVQDGRETSVPGSEIFSDRFTHTVNVPDLGELEAFPNGNATAYAHKLGIADTVRVSGRYALRWPGHCRLWHALKQLGFLDETPVPGLPGNVTPRQFMVKHLEPRLQYKDSERDIDLIRVEAEGLRNSRRVQLVMQVLDYRDMATGLTAMSRTVGFPAAIAARMIADGTIRRRGLLSPTADVPYQPFIDELRARNITVTEQETATE